MMRYTHLQDMCRAGSTSCLRNPLCTKAIAGALGNERDRGDSEARCYSYLRTSLLWSSTHCLHSIWRFRKHLHDSGLCHCRWGNWILKMYVPDPGSYIWLRSAGRCSNQRIQGRKEMQQRSSSQCLLRGKVSNVPARGSATFLSIPADLLVGLPSEEGDRWEPQGQTCVYEGGKQTEK